MKAETETIGTRKIEGRLLPFDRPSVDSITSRQKSLAFFTLIVALVLEIVDTTIVNTALPTIQRNFSGGGAQSQWVVAGYSMSFAILLILGGRLGDVFGYRRMFLIGVAGFTLASIACGLAPSLETLIAARVLQGACGSIMAPQVLALMQLLFDPIERIARLAWFGIIGGIAAIVGPILGGLLIAADLFGSGWRSVFLINGPIGLIAVAAGLILIPTNRRLIEPRIDVGGTAIFGLAVAALLFPLIRGDRLVWHWQSIASFGISIVLFFGGWAHLKRRARIGRAVIFDPLLMRNDLFVRGLSISVTYSAGMTGFLFIFAYSLQRQLGYTPLQTGLIHLPFSLGVMFGMGFIGRRFLARLGKKILIGGAFLLMACCGFTLSWIEAGSIGVPMLIPALIAGGIGMGMLSGPIPPVAVATVERVHAGAASGLLKTTFQLGGALGVAIVGSAYFSFRANGVLAALVVIETLLLASVTVAFSLPKDIFQTKSASQTSVH